MFSLTKSHKKSQISIFIITALIILTIFIIFIKFHVNIQSKKITTISTGLTSSSETIAPEEIRMAIKEIAKDSLEQALIISGLKGGFIYDHYSHNYTYLLTNYPSDYNNALISRLNINLNNMKVLVWGKSFLRSPQLTSAPNYYNNNIKTEMEKFIYYSIKKKINNKIRLSGWNITWAGNLNTSLKFNDDSVVLTLNCSFLKKNPNNKSASYYDNEIIKENIRYKTIFYLMKALLTKKLDNRSLNLKDKSLKQVFRESLRNFGLNPSNFDINIIKVIDKEDYKGYIFEIKDKKSKILNNPYIFRAGYINNATVLDLTSLGITNHNNKFYIGLTQDNLLTIDLSKYVKDTEAIDILNPNYFFPEKKIDTVSASFEIKRDGTLKFIGHRKGIFGYPITLTDNEVKKTYEFYFVIGSPSNKNNEDAKDCFEIEPLPNKKGTTTFPVSQMFKRTFEFIDSKGEHHLFGYALSNGKARVTFNCMTYSGYKYEWEICNNKDACTTFPISSKAGSAERTFNIGTSLKTIKVIISSSNPSISFTPVTYKLEVYPAECLGPFPKEESDSDNKTILDDLDGTVSCCDFSQFSNIKDVLSNKAQYASNLPPSKGISNLAPNGQLAFTFDAYLCMVFNTPKPGSDETYNPSETDIWSIDPYISSVFEAKIKGVCTGTSPIPKEIQISPLSKTLPTKQFKIKKIIDFYGADLDTNSIGSVNYITSIPTNSTCQYCQIPTNALAPFKFIVKVGTSPSNSQLVRFNIGLKKEINEVTSTIPSTDTATKNIYFGPFFDPSQYIRCDNNWYYYDTTGTWLKMIFGKTYGLGKNPKQNIVSRNYCSINMVSCNRKEPLVTDTSELTDQPNLCKDNYVYINNKNNLLIRITPAPSTWTCNHCNYICHCKNSSGSLYAISTKKDIKCTGKETKCPEPVSYINCETLCQTDSRHGHKTSVDYTCY